MFTQLNISQKSGAANLTGKLQAGTASASPRTTLMLLYAMRYALCFFPQPATYSIFLYLPFNDV